MSIDDWTGRMVLRVPLSEGTLARAGAFARAGHPSLQSVLRVDRRDGEIWLDVPTGARLVGALSAAQMDSAKGALEALHRAGTVHGSVALRLPVGEVSAGPVVTADGDVWLGSQEDLVRALVRMIELRKRRRR